MGTERNRRLPGSRTVREWYRMMREMEDDEERVSRDVEVYRQLGRGTTIFDLDHAPGEWDVSGNESEPTDDPSDDSGD